MSDAGVTSLKELRCLENPSGPFGDSSWAFVSVTGKIYVAQGTPYALSRKCAEPYSTSVTVLVCFRKGGGKSGQHGWILSTPSIHSLSNIGVQVFEYAYLQVFHAVHEADAHLQIKRHELIPGRQLLTVLQKTPCLSLGVDIEISKDNCAVFHLLEGQVSQIGLALKFINSRKANEPAEAN